MGGINSILGLCLTAYLSTAGRPEFFEVLTKLTPALRSLLVDPIYVGQEIKNSGAGWLLSTQKLPFVARLLGADAARPRTCTGL
jgi:hypothetical protein